MKCIDYKQVGNNIEVTVRNWLQIEKTYVLLCTTEGKISSLWTVYDPIRDEFSEISLRSVAYEVYMAYISKKKEDERPAKEREKQERINTAIEQYKKDKGIEN